MNDKQYMDYTQAENEDLREDRNRWRTVALALMACCVFLGVALFGGCGQ